MPIFNFAVEADDNNPVVKEKVKSSMEGALKNFSSILKSGYKMANMIHLLIRMNSLSSSFSSIERHHTDMPGT